MQPPSGFASADRGSRARLARWARIYRAPVTMTVAFLAVFLLFLVTPDPGNSNPQPSGDAAAEAEVVDVPARSPCPACPIGQRCDESTGQCVVFEKTPIPCTEGTHYDEEQQYCVPDATAAPTRAPRTARAPRATPVTPTFEPDDPPDVTTPRPPSTPDAPATPQA